ncbi:MAG TPA: carboxypeptidase-like regulatory domain-containing protein [Kofleriaceae bacterium]|nr:carboxypeptidase-like regulatory domain-containing protein [Kofleriaceae bacterium]
MTRTVVVWLALVGVALADPPHVEIKAQTELGLTHVRLRDGEIEVTGRLVDKLTGEGMAGQTVRVTVAGVTRPAETAPDGSFHVSFVGDPGEQRVELAYGGGRAIEPAAPLAVTADPAKGQVELAIAKQGDDKAGAKLVVHASGDDGPVRLPVAIELAPAGSGAWKPLRQVASDTPFVLSRTDTGGPGSYRIRATFAGDAYRQTATIDGTVELTTDTTTTIDVARSQLAYEDDLVVTGRVADDDGKPVARAAVTLSAGDHRLAQGATGDDGGYRFSIEAALLGECQRPPCQFGLQTSADPDTPFVRASRSAPAVITVAAPQPVPVSYTIAAFLATALAAGGFFAARSKPWLRLRKQVPPAEVPSDGGELEAAPGGLVVAKPGVISTLRRAADDGFAGVVRDSVRGRPVAQAVVRLVLGDAERELRTAADGSFTLEKLAVGEWRAEVAAPGHVTERFAVTIPHRGELRGVRIDLVPVRERVFQLYRRAAEPVLPESRLWGIWSPRQIVDHVRARRPTPALAELTDFVEEVYFSPRLSAETVLAHAAERVDRAILERAKR